MERHRAQERDACGIGFVADPRGTPRRDVVELALQALARVRHRGATAADARTGDGAGVLLAIPRALVAAELGAAGFKRAGLDPSDADRIGLAMLFDRSDDPAGVRRLVEDACRAERIAVAGWRTVPTDPSALGWVARRSLPRIEQAVLVRPWGSDRQADRAAYRARRRIDAALRRRGHAAYLPSMSFSTVTYKALASAERLPAFYPDLADPRTASWFALYHQRFSTNTTPSWERAQPFRLLGHNGEINAIEGNRRRMQGRAATMGITGEPLDARGSDSAMLDEAAELLLREPGGDGLFGAIATLIPPAWEHDDAADPVTTARHRWSATAMEPWDGPAAVVFADGRRVGATLDRNGLRPLPYTVADDLIVCGSEAGAVELEGAVRRGRVGAGELLGVDPARGGLQSDPLREHARRKPYRSWAAQHVVDLPTPAIVPVVEPDDLRAQQVAHGYTREELTLVLKPMAANGVEPTFSMGDDTPITPLGGHGRPIYAFFRQRFAQVTNPAIDHLRERSVMSLRTRLGPRRPLLADGPADGRIRELRTFLLDDVPDGHALRTTWLAAGGPGALRTTVERLRHQAVEAVQGGAGILLVGADRADPSTVTVPTLLAVGTIDAALTEAGIADRASIVAVADDAREGHHVACLLGFGADAIVPRLALETVRSLSDDPDAVDRYRTALEQGVLKVLAKLGISCLDSYRGARLFDPLGVGDDVLGRCFPGLDSPIGGWTFDDFAADALDRHAAAFGSGSDPALANPGLVKFRRGGEHHANAPDVVRALHETVDPGLERLRSTAAAGADDLKVAHALQRVARDPDDRARYERFAALVDERPPSVIRDLLEPRTEAEPIPLDEVEPASAICRRFSTGAVSHGSISKEAHETLTIAMHLIGGRSNTGEGGEERSRFRTDRNSAIKQVASGRFGVTPEYLAFGQELQIKIAQGSKPGEGGQIPANKVTEEIARLRHTQPGVPLISPAPHHDIYSIEDLAQLIFDLRQVNPSAEVSVKLVASSGVGTVAAGVVKAGADIVQIAGADGGTGASPLSSIKHAGLPWELGLAETQQVLSGEGLRGRVRLRVDGGLKTGRDVLVAALLGADEFSFGTAALLAEGCIMVRTCHLDTCPAGIATQRPELRARFAGTPDMVAGYLTAVAEHVRRLLASLGLRSLDEAIGRTDLLVRRAMSGRAARLDPSPLLEPATGERRFAERVEERPRSDLGDRLLADAWPRLLAGDPVDLEYRIGNADRSVGARLGGAIGRAFGDGAPTDEIRVRFDGVAGQSFGAFLTEAWRST
jgi:glutamate synthase (ferredoxin)